MLTYHIKELDRDGAGLNIQLQRWKNKDAFPMHKHDFIEINYAVNGNGVNTVGHFSHPVIRGDIYIIRPGTLHSFYTHSELVIYNLAFSPASFTAKERAQLIACENFSDLFLTAPNIGKNDKLALTPSQNESVGALFSQLLQEHLRNTSGHQLSMKSLLLLLLIRLCRFRAAPIEEKLPAQEDDMTSLSRILDFVNRNYLKRITCDMIARTGNLSKTYASEFFRKHTGVPLLKYINTLRLEHAKTLLEEHPELNIGEIASLSGFPDTCYFTRLFRQQNACAPSLYRVRRLQGK